MASFDDYLATKGYKRGSRLDSRVADMEFTAFEMAQQPISLGQPRAQAPSAQQSNPMMGAATNIGLGMLKNQTGGGTSRSGFGSGGGWGGVPGGAISGAMAGHQASINDPNMRSGKDGFGKHWRDSRAEVGGATAGAVLGYYGLGDLAGPVVTAAHPVMEPATRALINFGDSWGGAGGALMMDPLGTVSSGKYSATDLLKGAVLGPFDKFI